MNRKSLLTIVAGALLLSCLPASAQYYDPYRRPPPPPGWDRRPPPPPYGGGYYRQPRYVNYGNTCYTSRGACGTRPTVVGTICKCFLDGFGVKRGTVR